MIINQKQNIPRFSLYYLDEGELYIKDFAGNCQFLYPLTSEIEQLKGVIHFCTRSIVFEPDSEEFSIVKFHFRNFIEYPRIQLIANKEMFKFKVNRITIIPTFPLFDAYKFYDQSSDIIINFFFEKVEVVAEIIFELLDKFHAKKSMFEFDSIEYLGTLYSFQFDYTLVKTINEKFILKNELIVKQLLPLIEIPGTLMLTDSRIYFQPVFKINVKKCISIKYNKITHFYKRKITQGEIGLEICCDTGIIKKKKNLYILFDNESNRDMIYEIINNQTSLDAKTNISIEKYCQLWVEGAISNYEYLILLNSAGNRTRNDLSQYPIFPWILSNYTSTTLDLSKSENFRDLKKPIGALNPLRLKRAKERYNQMPEPKYLYGTHYSTPAYVIGYLVRQFPNYMLKLHSGKFDHPDRLFSSIEIDWKICQDLSFKELIPEFYESDPTFLRNDKKIYFGLNTEGEKIDNVKLPPWALDQEDFLGKMREALESDYVNMNIHHWIDLIFGYKQRGEEALKMFHPLCYDGGCNINENSENAKVLRLQINEFGQVSKQIFKKPHPQKYSNKIREIEPPLNSIEEKQLEVKEEVKEDKKETIVNNKKEEIIEENNEEDEKQEEVKDNEQFESEIKFAFHKPQSNNVEIYKPPPLDISYDLNKTFIKLANHHKKQITSSTFLPSISSLVTGADDGFVKLYNYSSQNVSKEFFLSSKITSICSLNSNSLIAVSNGDCIDIINIQIGKSISHFYAHETQVEHLYNIRLINILISDTKEGEVNIWDMIQQVKIPNETHYIYNDTLIVDSDFNSDSCFYFSLDNIGNVHIDKIKGFKEEIYDGKVSKKNNKANCIKSDIINLNQFYVGYEKGFAIYDIRTMSCIEEYEKGEGVLNVVNDSNNIILFCRKGAEMYNINESELIEINKWSDMDVITHSNFGLFSTKNKGNNMVIVGNLNGGLLYSKPFTSN